MHWIQKYVIHQLCLHAQRRYSELKPADVEGNLFMYHLKCLMQEGLVAKQDKGYTLTPEGRRYVDRLSFSNLKPRIQPKIVSMVAAANDTGEWLLYKRLRQPFTDLVTFPVGKLHMGETVLEAAHRELFEKTLHKANNMRHLGDAYITVHQDGELLTQMLCHISLGEGIKGSPLTSEEPAEYWHKRAAGFWAPVGDPNDPQYAPWFADLYQLANTKQTSRFFEELSYELAPAKAAAVEN